MLTRMRIRHDGKVWEEETHWLFRTYSPAELKSLLRQVPELKLLECYDFRYDLAEKRKVDASHTDVLLVLRRE